MKMLCTGLKIEISSYLGVTKEERRKTQQVSIEFEFQNIGTQHCIFDDNAEDYVCYQKIAKIIFDKFHEKEIRLLEYMCYQVYQIIKSKLPKDSKINVCVQKQCKNIVADHDASANCRYLEFTGSI